VAYDLDEINYWSRTDPEGFVHACDERYNAKVSGAADLIENNLSKSPIVFLSGPSGSGKTTTAKKIAAELQRRGIKSYYLSMDNYFRTVDDTTPKTPEGELDLESPMCVDTELLNRHFDMLYAGEEISVPRYDFANQRRADEPWGTICLGHNEVVVVEGIHALNDNLTEAHPSALKLYVSARSVVEDDGDVVFKGTWMRLVRRVVRDYMFRGAAPEYTYGMWANVRKGEKHHISPFKHKADCKLDSSFSCEVGIFKGVARELFRAIPPDTPRVKELHALYEAFDYFEDISAEYLAPESLLREFIGGGIYDN